MSLGQGNINQQRELELQDQNSGNNGGSQAKPQSEFAKEFYASAGLQTGNVGVSDNRGNSYGIGGYTDQPVIMAPGSGAGGYGAPYGGGMHPSMFGGLPVVMSHMDA